MSIWNSGFEAFPTGRDSGSVTYEALIALKAEVKARHNVEHELIISGSSDTTLAHRAGECQIVKMSAETLVPLNVVGALQFDTESKSLYYDRGAGLGLVLTSAAIEVHHGGLTNLTDPAAHTIYALLSGDTLTGIQSSKTGALLAGLAPATAPADFLPAVQHFTTGHPTTHITSANRSTWLIPKTIPYTSLRAHSGAITSVSIGPGASVLLTYNNAYTLFPVNLTQYPLILLPAYDPHPPVTYNAAFRVYNPTTLTHYYSFRHGILY